MGKAREEIAGVGVAVVVVMEEPVMAGRIEEAVVILGGQAQEERNLRKRQRREDGISGGDFSLFSCRLKGCSLVGFWIGY